LTSATRHVGILDQSGRLGPFDVCLQIPYNFYWKQAGKRHHDRRRLIKERTMHVFANQTRHGLLKTVAMSAILLTLVAILHADDKSPKQILGGKPAATSSGSSRYYDGHGAFSGRSAASGSTTRLYDRQGRTTGRVDSSKDSTREYDRSGSFAGRSTRSGEDTRFYDRKGSFNGRSTTSGHTTRFYDNHGAYSGKAETSGSTTKYYNKAGKYVGRKTN
jgi:hypothetical protein